MKTLLDIGDAHVGEAHGVSLPEYLSPKQRRTTDCLANYERWNEVRDYAGKLDGLIIHGDMADGANLLERGDDRTDPEKTQVEIAAKLIRDFRGSPGIFYVDGSPYHRGIRNLDRQIAEAVGAEYSKHYESQAPPIWTFKVEDVYINVAHWISVSKSTWQYMTTPVAREMVLAMLNRNPAQIVLRGHAHYMVGAFYSDHVGIVCPGFQTKTPFQARISPLGEYRLGAVKLTVDGSKFDWDLSKLWKTEPELGSLEHAKLRRKKMPKIKADAEL